MKKIALMFLAVLVFGGMASAQSLDLIVGARYNINQLNGNYQYSIVVPDVDGWPLRSNYTKFSMEPSQEAQIGLRFNFKNSLYLEANYSNNVTRINLEDQSNYSDSMLNALAYAEVYDTWFNSSQNLGWESYYDEYFDVAKAEQREFWRTDYTYTEEIKNHNSSLLLGYKFLQNRPVRPFLELGVTWMYQYRQYLYQFINQSSEFVPNNLLYYEQSPRVWYNLWFGTIGAGLQVHRLKAGVRLRTSLVELEQPVDIPDPGNYNPLYNAWNQYGFYLHYDLFSADIVKAENKKKLKELEHVVAGEYERKEKKFVLGVRLNYPITSNIDRQAYRADSITVDNIVERQKLDFDTVITSESYYDMRLDRIRRVQQSP